MLKAILKVSIWKSQRLTAWFFRYLGTESQGQSLSMAMPLSPAFSNVSESLVRATCTNKNCSLRVYWARQDAFVISKCYSANGGRNMKLSKTVDILMFFVCYCGMLQSTDHLTSQIIFVYVKKELDLPPFKASLKTVNIFYPCKIPRSLDDPVRGI